MTLRYACLLPALLGLFACHKDPPAPDTRSFYRAYNLSLGKITDLRVQPDGGALALGQARFADGDYVTVLQLTSTGDTAWTRRLFRGSPHRLALLPDGGTYGTATQASAPPSEQVFFRLDAAGRLLWRQTILNDFSHDNLTLTPDGGCLVLCNSLNQYRYELRKYTATGSLSWSRSYTGVNAGGLQPTLDGNFVIAAELSNAHPTTTALIKLDPQGTVRWSRPIGQDVEPATLVCLPDSGFAVTGPQWQAPYTTPQFGTGFIRTDKAGQVQFARTYAASPNRSMEGMALVYTPSHEFIIVGQGQDYQPPIQSFVNYSFVLRTTDDGQLISNNRYTDPLFATARSTPDDCLLLAGYRPDKWVFQKFSTALR